MLSAHVVDTDLETLAYLAQLKAQHNQGTTSYKPQNKRVSNEQRREEFEGNSLRKINNHVANPGKSAPGSQTFPK